MRKNLLAATIALAFGGSLVGTAQASAVAQSVLQVTGFQFVNAGTGVALDAGNFDILNIQDARAFYEASGVRRKTVRGGR